VGGREKKGHQRERITDEERGGNEEGE